MRGVYQMIINKRFVLVLLVSAFFVCVSAHPVQARDFGIPDLLTDDARDVLTPTDLSIDEVKVRSISVSWNLEMHSLASTTDGITSPVAVTSYVVKAYNKKTGQRVKTVRTLDTKATIRDLKINKAYWIKVWAERGDVISEPAVIVARTLPAKPKGLSVETSWQDAQMNADGSSTAAHYQAKLRWKAPKGTVKYYKVKVYRAGESEVVYKKKTRKRKAVVAGLEDGQEYEYTVTAFYNKGHRSKKSKRKSFAV